MVAIEPKYKIVKPGIEEDSRYLDLVCEVFSEKSEADLKKNMKRFDERTKFYVYELADRYCALLFVHPIKLNEVTVGGIGAVAVRPDFRKKGYGGALIQKAILHTKQSYPALLLWTRVPGFFRKYGFEDVSPYFVENDGGSMPMMFLHKNFANIFGDIKEKFPRNYF